MLNYLLDNKLTLASAIVPYWAWKTLISNFIKLRKEYEAEKLFMERHNCVVTYSANKGMRGWPPNLERFLPDLKSPNFLETLFEPVLYFIRTAKSSLDIAMMLITQKQFYDAILDVHKRGVKVRMLLNYDDIDSYVTGIRELTKEGIKIALYISHNPNKSIMHYKYLIKDESYILTGSINLTGNAFLNNYEDLVISSDLAMVMEHQKNFEQCFQWVLNENENLINKTMLLDLNLD